MGPLFSLATTPLSLAEDGYESLVYSGGIEGTIRIWKAPSRPYNPYGESKGFNGCIGVRDCHQDVIWDLVHSPKEDRLLSVSSDGAVKMWKSFDPENLANLDPPHPNDPELSFNSSLVSDDLLGSFTFRNSLNCPEVPTSACWVYRAAPSVLVSYR